jgi:hypothetical protein
MLFWYILKDYYFLDSDLEYHYYTVWYSYCRYLIDVIYDSRVKLTLRPRPFLARMNYTIAMSVGNTF